jgi:hypothetical protein
MRLRKLPKQNGTVNNQLTDGERLGGGGCVGGNSNAPQSNNFSS